MAVSEAFIARGTRFAKERALYLIIHHVSNGLRNPNAEQRLEIKRGLLHARELGRQHGFEDQVIKIIEAAPRLIAEQLVASLTVEAAE